MGEVPRRQQPPEPNGRIAVEKLLGPEEVADLLGVPIQTLYNWRSRGIGPRAVRVGRHLRYRPGDLDAWVESQTQPA